MRPVPGIRLGNSGRKEAENDIYIIYLNLFKVINFILLSYTSNLKKFSRPKKKLSSRKKYFAHFLTFHSYIHEKKQQLSLSTAGVPSMVFIQGLREHRPYFHGAYSLVEKPDH